MAAPEKDNNPELASDSLSGYRSIFEEGIVIDVYVGCSLKSFLIDELEISETFIEKELPVIFLDGHPVDDLDNAIVADGSQIALSGSLPGLAGISLRRQSPAASFRSSITPPGKNHIDQKKKASVTIKLFNTMVAKLGPLVLKKINR